MTRGESYRPEPAARSSERAERHSAHADHLARSTGLLDDAHSGRYSARVDQGPQVVWVTGKQDVARIRQQGHMPVHNIGRRRPAKQLADPPRIRRPEGRDAYAGEYSGPACLSASIAPDLSHYRGACPKRCAPPLANPQPRPETAVAAGPPQHLSPLQSPPPPAPGPR